MALARRDAGVPVAHGAVHAAVPSWCWCRCRAEVAERVEAYAARARGRRLHCMRVARRYATGSLGLALIDFQRSGYMETWDPTHTGAAAHGACARRGVGECAATTRSSRRGGQRLRGLSRRLARAGHVAKFYDARGFVVPRPAAAARRRCSRSTTGCTCSTDYGSTVECEIEVFGFIARANDDPRGFSLLAMVVSLFETGYLPSAAGSVRSTTAGTCRTKGMAGAARRRDAPGRAVRRARGRSRPAGGRLVRVRRPPGRGGAGRSSGSSRSPSGRSRPGRSTRGHPAASRRTSTRPRAPRPRPRAARTTPTARRRRRRARGASAVSGARSSLSDMTSTEDGAPIATPVPLQERLEQLAKLKEEALHAGSEAAVQRQHERGKLTARERIELLLDPGSFVELDMLARHRAHGFGIENNRPLTDGVVTGWGTIDGRKVFVFSPGLHDLRRRARRGLRREDPQGDGPRGVRRRAAHRPQRRRRRAHPRRRRVARVATAASSSAT